MKNLGSASLLLFLFVAGCNYGGCPWTELSQPQSSSSCLSLHFADDPGATGAGGCVDPELLGHNGCTETLTILASETEQDMARSFAPGADIDVLVSIAQGVPSNGGMDFILAAMLGNRPVAITFRATGGYAGK